MTGEYVFLDLETTGLDEDLDSVLEIGILVTDKMFNVLGEFSMVISFDFAANENSIAEIVQTMHTENGLWNECARSDNTIRGAEAAALSFLDSFGLSDVELAGSTISFDRAFLKRHLPNLEKWFHYRNIDVSSFKVIFKKYGYADAPKIPNPFNTPHRALSDCYDTKNDLQYYLNYLTGN